ncbi:hypothetical protein NMI26_003448 [Salmonella enterica subsp. enterica serovar Braenderup]|nr:hypothetical protein [Salmonella enterica subsp. enterica serovar 4,[5],12:i:-]EJL3977502.1 hypothetical protein [Salmonella enterica subsp. enterica serovar Braenderup]
MLPLLDIYNNSMTQLQRVLEHFGWGIAASSLTEEEKQDIRRRENQNIERHYLDWEAGLNDFAEIENNNHIFYLSIKVIDLQEPEAPHAAIIMRFDKRIPGVQVYMIENFIRNQVTALNGKVFITALLFATIFATNIDINEERGNETSVILVNPDDNLLGYYRDFGFYQDVTNFSWMSAEVPDIEDNIKRKIDLMNDEFPDDDIEALSNPDLPGGLATVDVNDDSVAGSNNGVAPDEQ